jgi:division protein CdvB (Snf7/Vps24/ESCRT-III family)
MLQMCRQEIDVLKTHDKARMEQVMKLTSSMRHRGGVPQQIPVPGTLDAAQEELCRAVDDVCVALEEKASERVRRPEVSFLFSTCTQCVGM